MKKRPYVYQGDKPYVFVSYSRKDSEKVDAIIEKLNFKGIRIWYDNGIRPASEWSKTITEKINHSSYFMAFISENFLESENCLDELAFAKDKIPNRLLCYIQDISLPDELILRHGRIQHIRLSEFEDIDTFTDQIINAEGILCCQDDITEVDSAQEEEKHTEEIGFGQNRGTKNIFRVGNLFLGILRLLGNLFLQIVRYPLASLLVISILIMCLKAVINRGGDSASESNSDYEISTFPQSSSLLIESTQDVSTETKSVQQLPVTQEQMKKMAEDVVKLVNEERAKAELQPVYMAPLLDTVAEKLAEELAVETTVNNGLFRTDTQALMTIMTDYKVPYVICGENTAMRVETSEKVMEAWMNSDGHRSNILRDEYEYIGVGVAEQDGILYWVQIFTGGETIDDAYLPE